MLEKVFDFFSTKIWNIRVGELPKTKASLLTTTRVITLTTTLYIKNKCSLRASALTFYTLLSVVPIAALMFGIAKGLGLEENLTTTIRESFRGQEEVMNWILSFSNRMLESAKGGVIAGVGAIILIWSALKLMTNIEASFNAIWGIKQGRSFVRKISDYLTLLILCPLLLILISGTSAYATSQIGEYIPEGFMTHLKSIGSIILPLFGAWLVFTFLYMFIPNARVKVGSALLAGVFAGTLYLVIQLVYMYVQVRLTRYNVVYGSFAALPFFLLWLQATWMIILYGTQLSFAFQNVSTYELSPGDGPVSAHQKAIYSLQIVHSLAQAFQNQEGPLSDVQLSRSLEIPIRTTRAVLYELKQTGLVTELMVGKQEDALYQAAVPVTELTPVNVLKCMVFLDDVPERPPQEKEYIKILEQLWDSAAKAPANIPLLSIRTENKKTGSKNV